MPKRHSLIRRKFGRLIILKPAPPVSYPSGSKRRSLILCFCGKEFVACNHSIVSGHTQSCGCLGFHGHCTNNRISSTYTSWTQMKVRCSNQNHVAWPRYGGRGIQVCEAWSNSFESFLESMGERTTGCSLDRWPDKDGNYSCGQCDECRRKGWKLNCRWATRSQQQRNMRTNRMLTVNGITGCLWELCERFNANPHRVWNRLNSGWSPERAFLTPVRAHKPYPTRLQE